MHLYQWQKECLTEWEKNDHRGIINAITGAGKTVFALAAIDRLLKLHPGLKIKIVVPTIPLARQWNEALLRFEPSEGFFENDDLRPGFFCGTARDDPDLKVMIYIINSARASLAEHIRHDLSLNRHILLICDECHHYQSKENRRIFDFIHDMGLRRALYHCIGLSATPFGSNHDQVLLQSLGRQIYQYDYDTAVSQGVIAPFIVSEIGASFFSDEMKKYIDLTEAVQMCLARLLHSFPQLAGLSKTAFIRAVSKMASNADMDPAHPAAAFMIATYRRKEVSNLATARIRCALMLIEALRHTDRILVFCERISQAEQMVFELKRKFGNCCEIYHSKMGHAARKRAMEAFRDRRSRILVSCRCLDEGIDVPDANVAIVLSSTAVSRQRIQRLGRVIRRSDQKDCACLYYIYIRESTEDSAYLQGLEECESFSMRYFTQEGVFSNELYEYVASELLNRARNAGLSEQQIREIRRCLEEGLVRPDALLTEKIQCEKIKQADSVHDRNYWTVMKKTGQSYRNNDTGA